MQPQKRSMYDYLEEKRKIQEDEAALEWIMKRQIRTIMELPTEDQVYDNISFKLGAFYKRFWENQTQGFDQSTRKAGEIIAMA